MMPYLAIASPLDMPSSTTAFAAATFCPYVYLACLPSIDSSASLPNAFHICCHFLTVLRGMESSFATLLYPRPFPKSSAAFFLASMSCLTLRSVCMNMPPISYVQEMGGSSVLDGHPFPHVDLERLCGRSPLTRYGALIIVSLGSPRSSKCPVLSFSTFIRISVS